MMAQLRKAKQGGKSFEDSVGNLFISLLASRLCAKHWVSTINKRKSYTKSSGERYKKK